MESRVQIDADGLFSERAAEAKTIRVVPKRPILGFADGVALFVIGAGLFLLFLMWLLIALSAGVPGANWVVQCEYQPLLLGDGVLALAVWIVLRSGEVLLHTVGRVKERAKLTPAFRSMA